MIRIEDRTPSNVAQDAELARRLARIAKMPQGRVQVVFLRPDQAVRLSKAFDTALADQAVSPRPDWNPRYKAGGFEVDYGAVDDGNRWPVANTVFWLLLLGVAFGLAALGWFGPGGLSALRGLGQ